MCLMAGVVFTTLEHGLTSAFWTERERDSPEWLCCRCHVGLVSTYYTLHSPLPCHCSTNTKSWNVQITQQTLFSEQSTMNISRHKLWNDLITNPLHFKPIKGILRIVYRFSFEQALFMMFFVSFSSFDRVYVYGINHPSDLFPAEKVRFSSDELTQNLVGHFVIRQEHQLWRHWDWWHQVAWWMVNSAQSRFQHSAHHHNKFPELADKNWKVQPNLYYQHNIDAQTMCVGVETKKLFTSHSYVRAGSLPSNSNTFYCSR